MSPSAAPSSADRPPSSASRTVSKTLSRTSTSRSQAPVKGALEYGYPHGHLGHLTETESTTFAAFKTLLAEHKLYHPATPTAPASHDDATVLRYLRARRWDLPSAHAQFADTEAWRKQADVDGLYDSIDVEAYEASRRLYPQWTGRRDRRGIPIYLFEIRHLDLKTIAKVDKAAGRGKLGNLSALYENLTRFTQPLCSQLTDREYAGRTPITLSTNIVDVTGVTLKGYWNLKGHMQAASELATAHYPETLDRIFIIGAPSFFTTVWGWIKRWFDPVTVSKIFILSPPEVLPTLKSFIAIENIPKKYGGELDFNWNDQPKLDATITKTVEWAGGHNAEFPTGPLYWMPIDGGKRLQCVARGTVGGKERRDVVGSIPVAVEEVAAAAAVNGEVAANGEATVANEEAIRAGQQPVVGEPVVNGVAAADVGSEEHQQQPPPVEANGAALSEIASPASEKFVDAPSEPLVSPPLDIKELSLEEKTDEKKLMETAEALPNGNGTALAAA
ncbi:hypothetical protein N0V93_004530 [Gnomoniopsis smithogilvyi]|uniref:CRAL-TRIO domain-containing protein n=1 Tax=Gnomoniopsis smithogilvyi TaxID=1191159 RepID=A0A9W8YSS1_9PEZI|nr:hypothetical protein N0V93_004530 [Gnomoniopsis smithogilvyi]